MHYHIPPHSCLSPAQHVQPTQKLEIRGMVLPAWIYTNRGMFAKLHQQSIITAGNRTTVAAATIVSMAAAKKTQQNVFALYHSYNRPILLGFIWILDFHFKIVLVLRRRYLIPIRCNNGKRKMWPWRWLHHFDFQHWRWLHAFKTMVALFRAGNFWHTHSRSSADKYVNRLCDCCQVWYV